MTGRALLASTAPPRSTRVQARAISPKPFDKELFPNGCAIRAASLTSAAGRRVPERFLPPQSPRCQGALHAKCSRLTVTPPSSCDHCNFRHDVEPPFRAAQGCAWRPGGVAVDRAGLRQGSDAIVTWRVHSCVSATARGS